MEGKNNQNDSSSFVSELFGSKKTHPSSSSGVFGSLVSSQSPNVLGKDSIRTEVSEKSIKEQWDSILGVRTHDDFSKVYGGESQKSSIYYQDQRIGPCNLSSSIFYGGQDIIYPAQSSQNERKKKSLSKKDGEEDDLGIATRGDWWKGGLHY
ncbi:hypothetical protein MtrunA17_Chr4g0008721 [Medicago truncatula]|uniref:Plant/T7H20-70 protein n=1 Tax=Medicago truncatula TaxID=3880 RepID=A0A072UH25_MEDTR|nr:uncharacterized protein LOC25491527 [Medicago truncatula]KEH28972.1 plant/T7H20-70 protein [Medicago truncatula]RHN59015.1 hypothetical protein MtrunA17_Chr4g0008721 [Medicago truncatula]